MNKMQIYLNKSTEMIATSQDQIVPSLQKAVDLQLNKFTSHLTKEVDCFISYLQKAHNKSTSTTSK
ncbi:MAG: hypothetical protein RLZZ293_1111 [Pseudomonadota bacterium]|jgi:hypothetical protein